MIDIIIVRSSNDCIRKTIDDVPSSVEKDLCSNFRILNCATSCTYTDISDGKMLKESCKKLSYLADNNQKLKGLFQIFGQIDDAEKVVLLDAIKFSSFDVVCCKKALSEYINGGDFCAVYKEIRNTFPAQKYPRYDMLYFSDLGYFQYFGERDKTKRVCRFCGKKDDTDSRTSIFGDLKNSHAISRFLGNNHLFCLEECKACNEKFGRTIEIDLSNYYSAVRALGGRKSRDNKPLTSKGFNYEYDNGCLALYLDNTIAWKRQDVDSNSQSVLNTDLLQEDGVCLHNIYKLLVKFVIACIPNQELPWFTKTVEWINGKKSPKFHLLPPVYRYEHLENIDRPILCVYFRKDRKKDMPFCVGELRFWQNLFVFAIPYCSNNDALITRLHPALSKFVKVRYPELNFEVENYCDDNLRLVKSHIIIEKDEDGSVDEKPLDNEEIEEGNKWWRKRCEKMIRKFGTTDLKTD